MLLSRSHPPAALWRALREVQMRIFAPIALTLLSMASCTPASAPAPQQASTTKAPASVPSAKQTVPPATATAAAPDSTNTDASRATPAIEHWQCDQLLVDVTAKGDGVRLDFSGRSLMLAHAESLVGSRYTDGHGNEFTRTGSGAKLIITGEGSHDCTPGTQASPWNEAKARNVVFRAVGSEPGWWVEVTRGRAPTLRAMLDYGDRTIEAAGLNTTTEGFTGETREHVAFSLLIQRTACRDGMSGEAFEATARLAIGGQNYRGCGAFLDD
ncbi:MAG: hypothetical protein JWL98_673 [Xanthomonadaceae bacterium]|nr:hypothetical protein [Xanthomonadaceae bacterium]